jgi:hypothetical protein
MNRKTPSYPQITQVYVNFLVVTGAFRITPKAMAIAL